VREKNGFGKKKSQRSRRPDVIGMSRPTRGEEARKSPPKKALEECSKKKSARSATNAKLRWTDP